MKWKNVCRLDTCATHLPSNFCLRLKSQHSSVTTLLNLNWKASDSDSDFKLKKTAIHSSVNHFKTFDPNRFQIVFYRVSKWRHNSINCKLFQTQNCRVRTFSLGPQLKVRSFRLLSGECQSALYYDWLSLACLANHHTELPGASQRGDQIAWF